MSTLAAVAWGVLVAGAGITVAAWLMRDRPNTDTHQLAQAIRRHPAGRTPPTNIQLDLDLDQCTPADPCAIHALGWCAPHVACCPACVDNDPTENPRSAT